MANQLVHVPVGLLRDAALPAWAKLIWMVARLRPPGDGLGAGWLSAATGLSKPTVRKGLAALAAAGWAPGGAHDVAPAARAPDLAAGPTLALPGALLLDCGLGWRARVLYGALLLTPGFSHPCGQFSYTELAGVAHADPKTLVKAIDELVGAEWLRAERANRLDRVHFELTFPGLAKGLTAMAKAEWRLGLARHRGEGLMREYLSLLVDSVEYVDDAAPGFLARPTSGGVLELDRFYPPYRVAFEHNGPQHYRKTKKFTAQQAAEQRERDYIKLGICAERGITLVIIHPEDLTLKVMQQKLPEVLPKRDVTAENQLLIDYLEEESLDYRLKMSRI